MKQTHHGTERPSGGVYSITADLLAPGVGAAGHRAKISEILQRSQCGFGIIHDRGLGHFEVHLVAWDA